MAHRHLTRTLALGAVATLALAGCSSSDDNDASAGANGDEEVREIAIGYIPSYTDTLVTAFLAKDQLERIGYTVEMNPLTEVGISYTALANGDIDIYPSAWPDMTHAEYIDNYKDDLESLGVFYDQAQNFLAVPSYTDVESIADLADNADLFDGRITGIEPGAGLTAQTENVAMPEYGLDDFDLVTSSTGAMLAELETRLAAEEDIVVTLWKPYWAGGAYDVKELEDPLAGMGDPEELHTYAHAGFAEEHPEAAEYFAGFEITDEQWSDLENLVVNEYGEGQEEEAIAAWVEENPGAYDTLISE